MFYGINLKAKTFLLKLLPYKKCLYNKNYRGIVSNSLLYMTATPVEFISYVLLNPLSNEEKIPIRNNFFTKVVKIKKKTVDMAPTEQFSIAFNSLIFDYVIAIDMCYDIVVKDIYMDQIKHCIYDWCVDGVYKSSIALMEHYMLSHYIEQLVKPDLYIFEKILHTINVTTFTLKERTDLQKTMIWWKMLSENKSVSLIDTNFDYKTALIIAAIYDSVCRS